MVSHTNEVKHGVLGVPQALLDQYGAVSGACGPGDGGGGAAGPGL